MIIILAIQLFTFYYVKWQPWFEAYEDSPNKDEKNFASYENTAVFCVSMFQYISEAVIFSKGAPYRRSIFSNVWFVVMLVFMTAFSVVILLVPYAPLLDFFTVINTFFSCVKSKFILLFLFKMRLIPDVKFRLIILGISIIHFFVAFLFEVNLIFIFKYFFKLKFFSKELYN